MAFDNVHRSEPRTQVKGTVRIAWQDSKGMDKFASVKSCDISESGMRIELPEAVEPRSLIIVQSRDLGIHGAASVRYCTRQGLTYVVGLEFAAGLKWKPKVKK